MKILLIIFLHIFIVNKIIAQNLIPNPGFEDTLTCPSSLGIQACSDWTYATGLTANYHHRCSNNSTNGVPTTSNQETLQGDAMIGLRVFRGPDDTNNLRSYVQVALEDPLVIGQTYYFSMHVLLHMLSNHAIKEFGAYFSTGSIWVNTLYELQLTPQFENDADFLTDKTNWVQITGSFVANGNYNNVLIGNFNDNNNTTYSYLGNWGDNGSYYFIDEVCLSDSPTDCVSLVASVNKLEQNDKKLLRIIDSMGRDCRVENGKLLFYIYDDGSIEKKVIIE